MEIIEKTFSNNGTLQKRKTTQRIILHHSASKGQTVEEIDKYHKSKGWTKIGYHFYVRQDGKIYRGREEWAIGAHAKGANYNSIGICAEGNFEDEYMNETQKNSLKELVAYIKNKYNITKVQGHRDVQATACPGKNYPFDEIAGVQPSNTSSVKSTTNTSNTSSKSDNEISKVQAWLNLAYNQGLATDGIYGVKTKKALVTALQRELNSQFHKNLVVDGIFGSKTKNACVNVKLGGKGNITKILQGALICHGYSTNGFDGIFGAGTERAVMAYQKYNGLTPDGVAGKNTFEKLLK